MENEKESNDYYTENGDFVCKESIGDQICVFSQMMAVMMGMRSRPIKKTLYMVEIPPYVAKEGQISHSVYHLRHRPEEGYPERAYYSCGDEPYSSDDDSSDEDTSVVDEDIKRESNILDDELVDTMIDAFVLKLMENK